MKISEEFALARVAFDCLTCYLEIDVGLEQRASHVMGHLVAHVTAK